MSLFGTWREDRLVVLHSLQVGSDAAPSPGTKKKLLIIQKNFMTFMTRLV